MRADTEHGGMKPGGDANDPAPENTVDSYGIRILQSLRRLSHTLDVQSRRVAANYGVTVPQVLCLVKVVEGGPLTTNALSREVFLASSTVIGILDRLEEKGYLVRMRDTIDRRQVFVQATAKGRELIEGSPELINETLCNAFTNLSELEISAIALSLEKINELVEAENVRASTAAAGYEQRLPDSTA